MNKVRPIPFRKMNGLGNDFVVLDARAQPVALDSAAVRAIADRETGVGCDQLIVVAPPTSGDMDAFMAIWNNDGSEVDACGNATRCVADLLIAETGKPEVVIGTNAGLLRCTRPGEGLATVDMGTPRFRWDEIPLARPVEDTRAVVLDTGPEVPELGPASLVNVGNPHCIFWVGDVAAYDLARFGPVLEHHPIFPERANISLAHVADGDHIALSVWERGAGLTRACGTAACAVAVAAARNGLAGRRVRVTLPGGDLLLDWRESDDHILMTGPLSYDYEGTLPASTVEPAGTDA